MTNPLTISEAMKALGFEGTERSFKGWIKRIGATYTKIGRKWVFYPDDIKAIRETARCLPNDGAGDIKSGTSGAPSKRRGRRSKSQSSPQKQLEKAMRNNSLKLKQRRSAPTSSTVNVIDLDERRSRPQPPSG